MIFFLLQKRENLVVNGASTVLKKATDGTKNTIDNTNRGRNPIPSQFNFDGTRKTNPAIYNFKSIQR